MYRSDPGYLLPRYNTRRSSTNIAQYYDGIDGDNSGSEEIARNFLEDFENWKSAQREISENADVSSDSEESSTSTDDEIQQDNAETKSLRDYFNALLIQFPNHTMYLKAAAYQAGIYHPADSIALDPQINRFFRVIDNVDESRLPDEVAAFCKDLRKHSEDCICRDNALPFSKPTRE